MDLVANHLEFLHRYVPIEIFVKVAETRFSFLR